MEVYIDNLFVKTHKDIQHFEYLDKAFEILSKYKMKLNPVKCTFVVRLRKFLGFLIIKRTFRLISSKFELYKNFLFPHL